MQRRALPALFLSVSFVFRARNCFNEKFSTSASAVKKKTDLGQKNFSPHRPALPSPPRCMRSTALGRHLMRFVPSSSLSSLQSAASTSAPSASALSSSSSIVPLRSSSTSTFLLRAAASCRSSPRISSTWTPRAMSTGGLGSGKMSIAAAATAAAGATEATAAMATDAANAAAALKNPAHSSPSSSKRRAALDAVLAPLEAVVGPLSREPMVNRRRREWRRRRTERED